VTTEELILDEVRDLKHRLFGNGQPGAIGLLNIRMTQLESFKWKAIGAGGVMGALMMLLLEVLVRRFLGGYHG
jgi:hypothetical protein